MQHSILFLVRSRTIEKLYSNLEQHYDMEIVRTRHDALQRFTQISPNLVLIDIPSLRFDLTRLCADLQAQDPGILLFFLLSKGMRLNQLPRAHGYLSHPFSMRQLLRRLARILPKHQCATVSWQGLRLNIESNVLIWKEQQICLPPKLVALTQAFLRTPEEIVSRARLMQEVWGTDYLGDTRTLDVHIHLLRKSLKQLQAPFEVLTLRGKGYRLQPT